MVAKLEVHSPVDCSQSLTVQVAHLINLTQDNMSRDVYALFRDKLVRAVYGCFQQGCVLKTGQFM